MFVGKSDEFICQLIIQNILQKNLFVNFLFGVNKYLLDTRRVRIQIFFKSFKPLQNCTNPVRTRRCFDIHTTSF